MGPSFFVCRAGSAIPARPNARSPSLERRKRVLAMGVLLAILVPSPPFAPAVAATVITMSETTFAPATCAVVVLPLSFNMYVGRIDDATSTVTITCTNTTLYSVGLDAGTAVGATVATRYMNSGVAKIAYSLCSDPAHAINWGRTDGVDTVAGVGNGSAQVLTVYGQIASGQFSTPGTYSDAIVATVTY